MTTAGKIPPPESFHVPLWPGETAEKGPSLEVFPPFSPGPEGAPTVVFLPGGGYIRLSPYECRWAEALRASGCGAAVVRYRVAPAGRFPDPLEDAARAIRLLKTHANEWGLASRQWVLFGASAGGHLAALTATRPDWLPGKRDDLAGTVSARVDRLVLAYPVITASAPWRHGSLNAITHGDPAPYSWDDLSPERHVTSETPPVFLFHAAGDAEVSVENSLLFARSCWEKNVPAELHVFSRGGHGYRFAFDPRVASRWQGMLHQWLGLNLEKHE
jgi:acetyl esterase/lipase